MNASENGPDPASRRSIRSSDLIKGHLRHLLRYRRDQDLIPRDTWRHRLYWSLRRFANLVFPYYRRIVPTGIRARIPGQMRIIWRWALGVRELDVHIWHLKLRLHELGFFERAAQELKLLSESPVPELAQRASWMLAVWYANQRSPEGAAEALQLLEQALGDEPSDETNDDRPCCELNAMLRLGT